MPSLHTLAVHASPPEAKPGTPSSTPIVTASAWTYADMEALDAALGSAEAGYVYARNAAPTQAAFEAALTTLEAGAGTATYSSGMAAIHGALLAALAGGPRRLVVATELYGATQTLVK